MPKVFSLATLGKFEDASASIPLRQLNRAFERANVRLGEDPGGAEGHRKAQFRRYVAGVDQHDPHQRDRLGDAFGALIAEVAPSKVDYLVRAAESDGFSFADGVFRPTETIATSFAVRGLEDLASLEDHGRRLHLLANESPIDAIGGATELLESVCRTVMRLRREPLPEKADLADTLKMTLHALRPVSEDTDDANEAGELATKCIAPLVALVAGIGDLQGLSASHGRLAAGAAVTLASFVADTYLERAALKSVEGSKIARRRKR